MINQHAQEIDIEKFIQFINEIKEHRHSKIKAKYINKFEHLYFKRFGYHHNLNRHMQNVDNIDQDYTLSRHQNVPSSFTTTNVGFQNTPQTPLNSSPVHPNASSLQQHHLSKFLHFIC